MIIQSCFSLLITGITGRIGEEKRIALFCLKNNKATYIIIVLVVYRDLDAEDDWLTVMQAGQNMSYENADIQANHCPIKNKIN